MVTKMVTNQMLKKCSFFEEEQKEEQKEEYSKC